MQPKPVTIVQHEPDDPPGSIAVALTDLGVPFEVRRVDLGDELPGGRTRPRASSASAAPCM